MAISSILYVEGNFGGEKDLKLYYQGWLPPDPPRAVLVVAHGLANSTVAATRTWSIILSRGVTAFTAPDYRGHGKSEGHRGYVEDFSYYVRDLETFFDIIREKHPDLPFFLFGHSMGGTVATCFAVEQQERIKGLILSSPLIQPGKSVSRFHLRSRRCYHA